MILPLKPIIDRPALMLGLLTLALHLWGDGFYDYFRDELYFIACGQHLAWGYVDQPPLTPFIALVERGLFGDSLRGLRLVPALGAAGLVGLSCTAASMLGGHRFARWLAGLALLAAPLFRVDGLLLSTDFLQPLAWLAAALLILAATVPSATSAASASAGARRSPSTLSPKSARAPRAISGTRGGWST